MLTDMLTRQHTAKKHRGKLLLLGLDGAGKSTLVNHLSRISIGADMALYTAKGLELPSYLYPDPTRTLQTASYRVDNSDKYLQLVDLPGRRICRAKWYSAISDFSTFSTSSNNLNNLAPTAVSNTFQASLPIVAVLSLSTLQMPFVSPSSPRNSSAYSNTSPSINPSRTLKSSSYSTKSTTFASSTRRNSRRTGSQRLRKCVDYELKMDQRRHPVNLRASTAAASSNSKSLFFATPAAVAAELGPSSNQGRRNSHSTGASAVTNSFVVSSIFTNAVECCAQDRDSVRALCGWLNEELRKAPPS
ncbi:P-loop containing nucleoside triphosphate hydrolase [Phytophthora cactorum]|nr:P-loop containing nucleoside triphosphate hydrolase [Phytophthora cactorum]